MDLALGFPADCPLSPSDCVAAAQAAEEAGYSRVWVAEGRGADSIVLATAIAMRTRSIGVGTGIAPVFNRSPWLLAMGAAAADDLSRGRYALGLGLGHRAVVEKRHGLAYTRPQERLRDTILIVRAALSQHRVDYIGATMAIEGAELSYPPYRKSIPLYVAATTARTISRAASLADGIFLIFPTPSAVRQARGLVIAATGDTNTRLTAYVFTCFSEDHKAARRASRQQLAWYGRLPHYQALFSAAGYSAEAQALTRAWATGNSSAAFSAISDAMVDSLTASGDASDIVHRLDALASAGLDEATIYPYRPEAETMHPAVYGSLLAAITPGSIAAKPS